MMNSAPFVVSPSYIRLFHWEGVRDGGESYMRKVGSKNWQYVCQSSVVDRIEQCIQQLMNQGRAMYIHQAVLNCRDGVRMLLAWELLPDEVETIVMGKHHVTLCNVSLAGHSIAIHIAKNSGQTGLTVGDRDGVVVVSG